MKLLSQIKNPSDIKSFCLNDLNILAQEIREILINTISLKGGHIGSNLGIVELTIALHYMFDTPKDKFIFDVSHQGYVHKLLTGRNNGLFKELRTSNGLCGFLSRNESRHDCYGAGHAGTALSAALGMAVARDIQKSKEHVIALIGDAALTCGITMEAINNIYLSTKRLIIILNDNGWSISKNVGMISRYLHEINLNSIYTRNYKDYKYFLNNRFKQNKKISFCLNLFEKYNLCYLGPINGHKIEEINKYLEFCKKSSKPILLHVLTVKGKGWKPAINNPEKFHGIGPNYNLKSQTKFSYRNKELLNYQDIVGETLVKFAKLDSSIIGITAAMATGTGLDKIEKEIPKQFYDVGIAEEHATLFAAGLAAKGLRPVVAIYSTFLQRAYDPIIHDICLQNLPVFFCIDRAGISANDGPTHHGLFDIAYLRIIPNAILMQPKDENELIDMIYTGIYCKQPIFVRYPKGKTTGIKRNNQQKFIDIGKAEVMSVGKDIIIWTIGPMVCEALKLAKTISENQKISIGVTNARFIKPIDSNLLIQQIKNTKILVTIEDHVLQGGFGSAILETLEENNIWLPVLRIGWPDKFIPHGTNNNILRKQNSVDFDSIKLKILQFWQKITKNIKK